MYSHEAVTLYLPLGHSWLCLLSIMLSACYSSIFFVAHQIVLSTVLSCYFLVITAHTSINHYSCTTHCHGAQEQGFTVLCFLNYITSHCSGLTHCRDYPGEGICGGFVVLCFLNHITKSLLWHDPLSWRPKIIQISLW